MTARDDVMSNIRRSLGVGGREAPRVEAVEDRLRRAPRGVIPRRGQLDPAGRLAMFRQQAEAALATIDEAASAVDVPETIAGYLRRANLPARLRLGEDLRLAAMPWGATALEIDKGPSAGADLVGVNHAFAGVAETGTLVLASGAENPTTLNFLPDYAIVVLQAKDIVGDYETVWSRLRDIYGRGHLPRTVNWITGPSRSADIEQTMLLGAHGPRSLHIVIVHA